ncbi:hypothetical protein OJAV_G00157530 [Oryzias javanicus]|uniref:ribonuclease H n=1 Tax=Oryzias javanicus TaxID=123683 RepID=A0A437CIJ7_ORYJA|nr:hypothetical protein OJAV_G00157530 [Oryzias javanicus]
MCTSRRQPDNHKVQQINKAEATDQEFFIGSIQTENHEQPVSQINAVEAKKEKWHESLIINKKVLKVRLDTGADCNVISMGDLRKLRLDKKVSRSYSKLVAYSGQQIQTKGKIVLTCQYKDKTYDMEFEVIKSKAPAILGGESCEEMGLVKRLHVLKTETDILEEYEDLFTGLGCLPGLYHIKTDPKVSPVVHAPRKVPVALKDKIETELKRMESLGVITKQTEPTEWVNSMVTVTKPNKVRICIDPQDLNTAIKREHYPLKTIEEVVAEMPNARYFSVLDANHGFWQIQLDEESSHLCTFNTPFGRYRFNRLPFGISSAPEVFQRCIARHLEGLEGVVNVIDDILVWGESIEQHDRRLRKLLERIRSINLKLNKSKCKIRMTEITYIGHVLSEKGLKPDPEKVRAIQNMPAPEDKAALQRFTGLLQYLSKFIPNLSDISAPLRKLEGNMEWHWGAEQQQSFDKLKALVSQAPVLKYYDVNKPVTLSVDASSEGLGAVLLQEGQPVAYGSRALTDCQKRYAQIEKELLAIVFGCEKFHQYLYGRHVHVESDHKPLEVIFKKSLLSAPARLQRMLMRLQKYSLEVQYKPGKEMHVADALSRACLKEHRETLLDEELEVNYINHQLPVSEEKLLEFKNATAEDSELRLVAKAIQSGWPEKQSQLPDTIKQYWTFREELACEDGLIFKNSRLVVPRTMRSEMLRKIHESHLGIVKCKERARDVLYVTHTKTIIPKSLLFHIQFLREHGKK